MVCVCPPHTSMNLNSSSAHRSPMARTKARAAAGSRNSSTNFMSASRRFSDDRGAVEGVELVEVGLPHLLDGGQRLVGLALVDLGHGEPDMDEHPVAGGDPLVGEQPDADRALYAADVDLG